MSGARALLAEVFGAAAEAEVRAPGRVNLLGGHVDYNGGLVLPLAVPRFVTAVGARRADRTRRLVSEGFGEPVTLGAETPEWARLFEALVQVMLQAGVPVPGFEVALNSDVPVGAGLSSSAAAGVAVATLVLRLAGASASALEVARWVQAAEHRGLGVRSGLMDPLVSAGARAGYVMALDCLDETYSLLPLRPELAEVVIIPTATARALAASGYNERRAACERGLAAVQARHPEVRALAEVEPAWLDAVLDPDDALRCRHVVAEVARARAGAAALAAGDVAEVGRLMSASHVSLRDLYQVTTPELDALAGLSAAAPESFGGRVTGAGFGGATVHLVRPGQAEAFLARVEGALEGRKGWVARPTDGALALG
ncbi:MAG: hypothetical protein KC933_29355 [Myxococcales bacterium]|nr:hypothetical protein [Myxococcales bacterium]